MARNLQEGGSLLVTGVEGLRNSCCYIYNIVGFVEEKCSTELQGFFDIKII